MAQSIVKSQKRPDNFCVCLNHGFLQMKQLTDDDIQRMGSDDENISLSNDRNSLRILKNIHKQTTVELPDLVLDCHGMTIEQAFSEIERRIGLIEQIISQKQGVVSKSDITLTVITGKSGEIKRLFEIAITDGYLAHRIRTWRAINPGSYKISIKTK